MPADPYYPNVRQSVWSRDGLTLVSLLDNVFDVQWQDPVNDVGSGSFSLDLVDPDVALLVRGQLVQCFIYSLDKVFAWYIETIEKTLIDPSEEMGQIVRVSGRAKGSRFTDAKVYPPLGVDQMPRVDTRSLSFASPEYDDSAWDFAVHIAAFGDLSTEWTGFIDGELTAAPFGWPLLPVASYWIWTDVSATDAGISYFRQTFELEIDTMTTIVCTGDNYWTLYLDGVALLGDNTNPLAWQEHRRVQLPLLAGVHTLAAVVNNFRVSPAALLCAVYQELDDTYIGGNPEYVEGDPQYIPTPPAMILVSDFYWKCLGYPAQEPGFTPGFVLLQLFAEAQARGVLTDFIFDFDAVNDSNGDPWPTMGEIGFNVGDSMLDVLNYLAKGNWIDWRVAPAVDVAGDSILWAWNAEGQGTSPSVTFAAGVNIVDITHSVPGRIVNRLLVKYADGLFVVDDAVSQAARGEIIEEYLTLDAANLQEAQVAANKALTEAAAEEPAITLTVEPTNNADRCYLDYWPADMVTAPAEDGTPTLYRCLGVTVSTDDMGDPSFAVELNRRTFNLDVHHENLFHTLGSGVLARDKMADKVTEYLSEGD